MVRANHQTAAMTPETNTPTNARRTVARDLCDFSMLPPHPWFRATLPPACTLASWVNALGRLDRGEFGSFPCYRYPRGMLWYSSKSVRQSFSASPRRAYAARLYAPLTTAYS